MPFASEKQRRYLWAKKPDVARKFAEHEEQERGQKKSFVKRSKRKKRKED